MEIKSMSQSSSSVATALPVAVATETDTYMPEVLSPSKLRVLLSGNVYTFAGPKAQIYIDPQHVSLAKRLTVYAQDKEDGGLLLTQIFNHVLLPSRKCIQKVTTDKGKVSLTVETINQKVCLGIHSTEGDLVLKAGHGDLIVDVSDLASYLDMDNDDNFTLEPKQRLFLKGVDEQDQFVKDVEDRRKGADKNKIKSLRITPPDPVDYLRVLFKSPKNICCMLKEIEGEKTQALLLFSTGAMTISVGFALSQAKAESKQESKQESKKPAPKTESKTTTGS